MKTLYLLIIYLLFNNCFALEKQIYSSEGNSVNFIYAERKENNLSVGLEFLLQDNWKIYWKHPGDVGLPPSLRVIEGSNDNKVKIQWPFPSELYEKDIDLTSRVYNRNTVLPVLITLNDLINNKKKKN